MSQSVRTIRLPTVGRNAHCPKRPKLNPRSEPNIWAEKSAGRNVRDLLTATGFIDRKCQFSTPYRIGIPQLIIKKYVVSDYVSNPYSCQVWCTSVDRELQCKWVTYKQFYFYLYRFWEFTYRSYPSTDFRSNNADLLKDVPSFGLVDLAPHIGGHIP